MTAVESLHLFVIILVSLYVHLLLSILKLSFLQNRKETKDTTIESQYIQTVKVTNETKNLKITNSCEYNKPVLVVDHKILCL